jgi:hypothetical protein
MPFSRGALHMNLLDVIPLAWGAVTAFVVAACQVSSWADAHLALAELDPPQRMRPAADSLS